MFFLGHGQIKPIHLHTLDTCFATLISITYIFEMNTGFFMMLSGSFMLIKNGLAFIFIIPSISIFLFFSLC